MAKLTVANILLLYIFLTSVGATDNTLSISFAPEISTKFTNKQIRTIYRDLDFLSKMKEWRDFDPEITRGTDLAGGASNDLLQWLGERVKYLVIGKTGALPAFYASDETRLYPNGDTFPEAMDNLFIVENHNQQTMMANLGVSYYLFGKSRRRLISLNIAEHFPFVPEILDITSPRVGLIEVNRSFFNKESSITGLGNRPADKLLRLSFIFHEGRHSDGHGESLGFFHSTCPAGHDYAGRLACDTPANGAYQVSATFLKKSAEVCESCDEASKEALRLAYLDARNRILDRKILTPDQQETLNELENKLNELVRSMLANFNSASDHQKNILLGEMENLEIQIHILKNGFPAKVYWKSAPEALE